MSWSQYTLYLFRGVETHPARLQGTLRLETVPACSFHKRTKRFFITLPTTMAAIINIQHAQTTSNQGLLTTLCSFWVRIVTICFVFVTSKAMKLKRGLPIMQRIHWQFAKTTAWQGLLNITLTPVATPQALMMDATGQCPDRCTLNRNLALTRQWNLLIKKRYSQCQHVPFTERGKRGKRGAASDVLMEKNLLGLLCDLATIFTVSPNKLCSLNSAHWNPTQKTPPLQLNKGAPFNFCIF